MGRIASIAAVLSVTALTVPTAHAAPASAGPETIGGERLASDGVVVERAEKTPKLPKTQKMGSFVVADAGTGEILAAKDPHGHYLPASTLKILTAITLIPKLDQDEKVKPSRKACNIEGSAVGLKPTLKYRVSDLFKGLMLTSGNDAAVALAEANGGLDKTLDEMNEHAHHLQAGDTVARTPNGLDKGDQRSSAYDLALLARAGLQNETFKKIISTKTADFPAPKGKTYQIQNHNKLLFNYRGGIGVKNGYTEKARATYVGAATRGGRTLIVSLMKYENPPFWDDVESLLDWGFKAHGEVAPVGRLVDPKRPETAEPPPQAVNAVRPAAEPSSWIRGETIAAASTAVLAATLIWGVRRSRRRRA